MKNWTFIILLITLFFVSCNNVSFNEEKIIIERIHLVHKTIREIEKKQWAKTYDKMSNVPWIYYSDSINYVLNPNENYLEKYKPIKIEVPELELYKHPNLEDKQFNMELSITRNDSTYFDYMYPFLNTSSFEITNKVVPDVPHVEEWFTMLLHEKFHGYQFMHSEFLKYYNEITKHISQDSIQNVYKTHDWFKTMIDEENGFLLTAINTKSREQSLSALNKFKDIRKKRRMKYEKLFSSDIETVERVYELVEGSARYYDRLAQKTIASMKPYKPLKDIDKFYNGVKPFAENYDELNSWAYKSDKSGEYFYATGYNLMRVLDRLEIKYQEELFKDVKMDLEVLLNRIPN